MSTYVSSCLRTEVHVEENVRPVEAAEGIARAIFITTMIVVALMAAFILAVIYH